MTYASLSVSAPATNDRDDTPRWTISQTAKSCLPTSSLRSISVPGRNRPVDVGGGEEVLGHHDGAVGGDREERRQRESGRREVEEQVREREGAVVLVGVADPGERRERGRSGRA